MRPLRSLSVAVATILVVATFVASSAAASPPLCGIRGWSQEAKLKYIGTGAVAVSGSTALLTGAATFVYDGSDGIWSEQQELRDPNGSSIAGPIAISGSIALVGAPGKAPKGAVYVFVRSGETWSEEAELTASDGLAGDQFGGSVAISGSLALVGAPGKHPAGAVYVFVRSGTTWSQEAELTSSDGFAGDGFGGPVAISASTAVVGAPGPFRRRIHSAAYVFERVNGTWSEEAKLTSGPHRHDLFGASVAISGSTALIGAPMTGSANRRHDGAVHVFERANGVWSREAILNGHVGSSCSGSYFGASVALEGTIAVIGAPHTHLWTGVAYEFARIGSTWTLDGYWSGSHRSNRFGSSVATSGTVALVTAPSRNKYGNGFVGSYIFKLSAG